MSNIEENNFSKQFAPLWKQFKISQNILLLIWGTLLLILFFDNVLVAEELLKLCFIFLFILTLIWILYFSFKLSCPKCGRSVYPYGGYYGGGGRGWIYLTGECCYCGAVLKERKISKVTEKKLKKAINTIVIIICVGIIMVLSLVFIKRSQFEPQIEESKTVNWDELEQYVGKIVELPESDIMHYYFCPRGGGFCPPCDSEEVKGKIHPQYVTDKTNYITIGNNAISVLDVCFNKNEKCKKGVVSGKLTKITWKPALPEATLQTAYYLDDAKIIKCIENQ